MFDINISLVSLACGMLFTAASAAALASRLERRRGRTVHTLVLGVARQLARGDFSHSTEAQPDAALSAISQALAMASSSLRRQAQKAAALLELDRALLSGVGIEPIVSQLLPVIAAALQCRTVSIVLLDGANPHRARCYDFLLERALELAPREITIDTEQLRGALAAARNPDGQALGVDPGDFLEPLTRTGASAFRFCPLERDTVVSGFLCIGFRVDAHDNADMDPAEIAERLSLACARSSGAAAASRPALPPAAGAVRSGALTRSPLETGLHRALQRDEFVLAYQPIIDAHSHHCGGVEALLRWPHGDAGAVRCAAEFVPVAEESGLIVDLGDWVLRTACQQFIDWRRDGIDLDYVSVNVSARQLCHASLLPTVLSCLRRTGMAPSQLQIEFSASLLAGGSDPPAVLHELARRGVRLALDDFGAGTAMINALQNLPIHAIKIDRSCIASMGEDPTMRAIVDAVIIEGARSRRRVIAEGVERAEQLQFLELAGCDAVQGFLLAAPMPADELACYLRAQQEAMGAIAARAA